MEAVATASGDQATTPMIDVAEMYRLYRERKPRGAVDGWSFIHDLPAETPAVWGAGQQILWAEGEGTLIAGPEGVGKTTLAQQLVLGLCGYRRDLLGLPVKPLDGPVLYLALDRPRQIARSMARMVKDGQNYDGLAERLMVWQGPLPFDLIEDPRKLVDWAMTEFPAVPAAIVVDSYKDLASDLSAEATGWAINHAMQECLAEKIEWIGLHHQRKAQDKNRKPNALADVYGSRWLTAGTGSVVALWGEAGDATVEVRHLKQPAGKIGPLAVAHDHACGNTTVLDVDVSSVSTSAAEHDRRQQVTAIFRDHGEGEVLNFTEIREALEKPPSDKTLRDTLAALVRTQLLAVESRPGLPSLWRRA